MRTRRLAETDRLDPEFILNSLDAVLIIGIAIPSMYMAAKVRQPRLKLLTVLLSGFLLVHGLYHATAALGTLAGLAPLGDLSDLIIEPAGWVIFLAFAIYFARSTR